MKKACFIGTSSLTAYQDEDVFEGYGRDSAANMRRVSEKYDREGVFQKNVPGGFKLS